MRFVSLLLALAVSGTARADVSATAAKELSPPANCPVDVLKRELKAAPRTVPSVRTQTTRFKAQLASIGDDECRGALFRV
jgi:hypothetical protein